MWFYSKVCGIINVCIKIVLFVTSYSLQNFYCWLLLLPQQPLLHANTNSSHITRFTWQNFRYIFQVKAIPKMSTDPSRSSFHMPVLEYKLRTLCGLDTRSLTSVAASTLHFILQFSSISFVRYPIQNYRRHNICGHLHSWLLVTNLLFRRTGFDSRPTWLGFLADSVAWNRY